VVLAPQLWKGEQGSLKGVDRRVNFASHIVKCVVFGIKPTYTVSQKNDTDVALYNFNSHQPVLVISGRNVAERVHYQTVVSYATSPN